jgi:Na+/H+-dicarboxylate symporter
MVINKSSGLKGYGYPALLALSTFFGGLTFGIVGRRYGFCAIAINVIEPLGALWLNAISMTLIPLVTALLVTSVTGFANDLRGIGRLGLRTLALFLVLLTGTAAFAVFTAPVLLRYTPVTEELKTALRETADSKHHVCPNPTDGQARATTEEQGRASIERLTKSFIEGLIPKNPIEAAANGTMLPLIVFTLMFSVAITRIRTENRTVIVDFFAGLRDAMLIILGWIIWIAPIGIFALSTKLGAQLGEGIIQVVAYYVLAVCALVSAAMVLLYFVVPLTSGISLRRFAGAVAPAQLMALTTRSSLASLPYLIDGARKQLGDRPAITYFVLPLSVATFKLTTPIADLVGPLFLAHIYDIHLSLGQLVSMALVTIVMSFSNPGVPSGGLFIATQAVINSSGANIPIDGIALLVAIDLVPDIFNTLLNVTGNMAVATILASNAPLIEAPTAQ